MYKTIAKKIKTRLQKLKNSLKKIQEVVKEYTNIILWILGAYVGVNLLPALNGLLLKLPTGLFVILLTNSILIFYLAIKTYFDFLAVKICLQKQYQQQLLINAIHFINQSICIGFNIYILLCLTNSY